MAQRNPSCTFCLPHEVLLFIYIFSSRTDTDERFYDTWISVSCEDESKATLKLSAKSYWDRYFQRLKLHTTYNFQRVNILIFCTRITCNAKPEAKLLIHAVLRLVHSRERSFSGELHRRLVSWCKLSIFPLFNLYKFSREFIYLFIF